MARKLGMRTIASLKLLIEFYLLYRINKMLVAMAVKNNLGRSHYT